MVLFALAAMGIGHPVVCHNHTITTTATTTITTTVCPPAAVVTAIAVAAAAGGGVPGDGTTVITTLPAATTTITTTTTGGLAATMTANGAFYATSRSSAWFTKKGFPIGIGGIGSTGIPVWIMLPSVLGLFPHIWVLLLSLILKIPVFRRLWLSTDLLDDSFVHEMCARESRKLLRECGNSLTTLVEAGRARQAATPRPGGSAEARKPEV